MEPAAELLKLPLARPQFGTESITESENILNRMTFPGNRESILHRDKKQASYSARQERIEQPLTTMAGLT
jgi:hypothetical protein